MERGSAIETAEQEEATEANVVVAVAGIAVEIPAARATAGVEGEAEKAIVETSVQPQGPQPIQAIQAIQVSVLLDVSFTSQF